LYQDPNNDFLVLDNKIHSDKLCEILDNHNFSRMNCYSMDDCSEDELLNYFKLMYKSCDDYTILYEKNEKALNDVKLPDNATKIEIKTDNTWNVNYN